VYHITCFLLLYVLCTVHWFYVTSFLLQNPTLNALSEVRRAIVQLTSNPAEFDDVMLSLVMMLTDNLSDSSVVEAIVEDLFNQVCLCSFLLEL